MLLNIIFVFFSAFGLESDHISAFSFPNDTSVFTRYKRLLVDIRELRLTPSEAESEFKDITSLLKSEYPNTLDSSQITNFIFPLTKSNFTAVGGKGTGFRIRKFDLFDYTVSGSHPAHDIFIFDPDQDCMDNRKNEYVDIVSVGHGVVLAVEKNWSDTSDYKGGNYVWVFDYERGGLWYYAHHRKVVVEPGQIVIPGDKLGEVGRTGFNAKVKRSDTHLHLMFLELDENLYPVPKNYYEWLKGAYTINKSTKAAPLRSNLLKIGFLNPLPLKKIPVREFKIAILKKKLTRH